MKNNLNHNIATAHEGKEAYKSHFCDKSFFMKNYLNPNIATSHEGKKPFKCHFCDKSFFSE